jgi:hypothetical protein
MKFLFLLIVPIFSLKLCINCKHFIPDNKENIFGKCKMFPQIENKLNYLMVLKKMDTRIVQPQEDIQTCAVKMEKCSKKACIKNEKGDNGDIYK